MGRIVLNRDKCKACCLCIENCPNEVLEADTEVNAKGYYPAKFNAAKHCTGCGICAMVCPDMAVEKVYR